MRVREREATGKVISVSKQWWLKVNTKAVRKGIGAGIPVPTENSSVKIIYDEDSPKKAKIIY